MTPIEHACRTVAAGARRRLAEKRRLGPDAVVVVALDGPSGAGKTTLSRRLARELEAARVPGDDFFAAELPDAAWDRMSPVERAARGIAWRRIRDEALAPLAAGEPARWRRFDWESGARQDGSYGVREECEQCGPAPIVLLDGAYSSRPDLARWLDLRVLVDAPDAVRRRRLDLREDADFLRAWHRRWDPAEAFYFTRVRPPRAFDLVVSVG